METVCVGRHCTSSPLPRLFFVLFFVNRNRFQILRLEDLAAVQAAKIIDTVASIKELGSLVLTNLHSEITYSRLRCLPVKCAFKELAQNDRGIKRATRRAGEFLSRLVARIRALCALRKYLYNSM
jgi:hypothetical protein